MVEAGSRVQDPSGGGLDDLWRLTDPALFRFGLRALRREFGDRLAGARLLDAGSGDGYLAERFARAGLSVTGIVPAADRRALAARRAERFGLVIGYGAAPEDCALPFSQGSFDVAVCRGLPGGDGDGTGPAAGELARVLRPGGVLLFSALNRTRYCRMLAGTLLGRRIDPAGPVGLVRPADLVAGLAAHGLEQRMVRGIGTGRNPVTTWLAFRQRAAGRATIRNLEWWLAFGEGDDARVSYVGNAVRGGRRPES